MNKNFKKELKKLTKSIGMMFAPYCEVVLHDLSQPKTSIIAIENNITGRKIGDGTTNIGLKRVQDKNFPEVVQNYKTTLPDGRVLKSTSIGFKDSKGNYVASLCLNMDISEFQNFNINLSEFIALKDKGSDIKEEFKSQSIEQVSEFIKKFTKSKGKSIANLNLEDKKELIKNLKDRKLLSLKNSIETTANILGVSRMTVYNYLKKP